MPRGKQALSIDLPRPAALDLAGVHKTGIIHETLRHAICSGLLETGTALPATRTLAQRWQVSRGVVEVAFDLLCQEGYIIRKPGSGRRVSHQLPDEHLRARKTAPSPRPSAASAASGTDPPPLPARHLPFLARMPDPALLDRKAWSSCLASAALSLGNHDLGSSHPSGLPALRASLAHHLRMHRGISCEAQDILIVRGIRDILDLVIRTVLQPGDTALVEDPGYRWPRRMLDEGGARLVHVPVDMQGLLADEVSALPPARLLYTTPAHQSPLGHVLSLPRRQVILEWARRHQAIIIEDDHDGDFGHDAAPPPALKAQDRHHHVIYCASFDRILFPDIQVAYCILPPGLQGDFVRELARRGYQASIIEQAALARHLDNGHFSRHLRVCRRTYRQRRDLLLHSMAETAGFLPCTSGAQSGVHFVLWLPHGTDEALFCRTARQHHLLLQGISTLCTGIRLDAGVIVGYAALADAELRRAGRQLGKLLASCPHLPDRAPDEGRGDHEGRGDRRSGRDAG